MNEPAPEDLKESAKLVTMDIFANSFLSRSVQGRVTDIVAAALLSERLAQKERDAKIAEAHVICDWTKLPGKAVDDYFGRRIAAAIRSAE